MRNTSVRKPRAIGVALFAISAIGLVGGGVWVLGWMVLASTMESTEGKVLQVDIRHEVGGKKNLHYPEIAYEYSVEGMTYHGDVYSLIPLDDSGTEQWANDVVEQYSVGDACVVYYRKNNPHQSALTRSPSNGTVGFSVGMILLGLFALTLTRARLRSVQKISSCTFNMPQANH